MTRVAVVTGASAGVGRSIALSLARRGFDVGLLARGEDGLKGAADEVAAIGRRALILPVDVADAAAVDAAASLVEDELGPIEVWVNNAFSSVFGRSWEVTPDDFRRTTEVTYLGYVHGTRAALARMMPRDQGTIVQVGSALAFRGIPLQSAYCGAKHAIEGFTESVRTELLHDGFHIEIAIAQLPAMNTPQFDWLKSLLPNRAQPVPPIYQPEVAAEAIAYLAEHPRPRMWVGATTVGTIIGNRIAPGLLDRYLARTGVSSQQTDEPEDPDRAFNLYGPLPGDHGAHGRFDDRAHDRSLQVWATTHRPAVLAATGALVIAAGVAVNALGAIGRRRAARGRDGPIPRPSRAPERPPAAGRPRGSARTPSR